jgi:hypothetical protein
MKTVELRISETLMIESGWSQFNAKDVLAIIGLDKFGFVQKGLSRDAANGQFILKVAHRNVPIPKNAEQLQVNITKQRELIYISGISYWDKDHNCIQESTYDPIGGLIRLARSGGDQD